jgi:hypothetical protein
MAAGLRIGAGGPGGKVGLASGSGGAALSFGRCTMTASGGGDCTLLDGDCTAAGGGGATTWTGLAALSAVV